MTPSALRRLICVFCHIVCVMFLCIFIFICSTRYGVAFYNFIVTCFTMSIKPFWQHEQPRGGCSHKHTRSKFPNFVWHHTSLSDSDIKSWACHVFSQTLFLCQQHSPICCWTYGYNIMLKIYWWVTWLVHCTTV